MPAAPVPASTISWRVNAERIVVLGWGRAILLQLAHPLVAAGVFDHSGFRKSPWAAAARLRHTVAAMLRLTFGSEVERQRTIDGIRSVHRRIHGELAHATGRWPAGTPYSAEDPALVLWVHATIVESILLAHDLFVHPLSDAERDAYCIEAAPVALELLAREDEAPRSWDALRRYVDATCASGDVVVGAQARELAEAVLSPKGAWPVAPATWAHRLVTEGLLPPAIRAAYGIPWTPRRQRRFDQAVRALRMSRKTLPDALALWPEARRAPPGRA